VAVTTIRKPPAQGAERPQPAKGETLGDVAFKRLRADIVAGEWAPDSRLRFEDLRRTYGLNFGTLREGLSRLAAEGLVIAEGQRGYTVAPVSETDLRDVGEMRRLLDGMALRKSIERGDLDWETGVLTAFHRMARTPRQRPDDADALDESWEERHRAFHLSLIAGCGSALLLQFHAILFDRSDRYRRISFSTHVHDAGSLREHRAIMEATLARDAERACTLLEAHIMRTVENVSRTTARRRRAEAAD